WRARCAGRTLRRRAMTVTLSNRRSPCCAPNGQRTIPGGSRPASRFSPWRIKERAADTKKPRNSGAFFVRRKGLEPSPSIRGLAPQASASTIPPPAQVEFSKDEQEPAGALIPSKAARKTLTCIVGSVESGALPPRRCGLRPADPARTMRRRGVDAARLRGAALLLALALWLDRLGDRHRLRGSRHDRTETAR